MRPPNIKNAAPAVRAQSTLDLIQVIASKYNLNTFKTLSFYYLALVSYKLCLTEALKVTYTNVP